MTGNYFYPDYHNYTMRGVYTDEELIIIKLQFMLNILMRNIMKNIIIY